MRYIILIACAFVLGCQDMPCKSSETVSAIKNGASIDDIRETDIFSSPGQCEGWSPVWHAASAGRHDVVAALVEAGWSDEEKEVGKGYSEYIIWMGFLNDWVGYDLERITFWQDTWGNNAFLYACKRGKFDKAMELAGFFDVNSLNKAANSCLHIAAGAIEYSSDDPESFVGFLVDNGIQVNQMNVDGDTALGSLIGSIREEDEQPRASQLAFLKILLRAGVLPDLQGKGHRPLYKAFIFGHLDAAGLLLDHGARTDLVSCDTGCYLDFSDIPEAEHFLLNGRANK